jgi:hypothetical protein
VRTCIASPQTREKNLIKKYSVRVRTLDLLSGQLFFHFVHADATMRLSQGQPKSHRPRPRPRPSIRPSVRPRQSA